MDKCGRDFCCSDCGLRTCDSERTNYPKDCLTTAHSSEELEEISELYRSDPKIADIYQAAAEIEGRYYGRLTRVEEIIVFAKKLGVKKLGIATCMGLINEAVTFTKILRAKGIEDYVCVGCKVGSLDKEALGIPDDMKVHPGCFEPACNPVMQAKILNEAGTDLNVILGLCVGHDTLFMMHSKAPCTALIVKDRVLVHNPAAALYSSSAYYRRLLNDPEIKV